MDTFELFNNGKFSSHLPYAAACRFSRQNGKPFRVGKRGFSISKSVRLFPILQND